MHPHPHVLRMQVLPGAWRHIKPDGQPAYDRTWAWCGNFQGGCAVVRAEEGGVAPPEAPRYQHIFPDGVLLSDAMYAYAGDFREARQLPALRTELTHTATLMSEFRGTTVAEVAAPLWLCSCSGSFWELHNGIELLPVRLSDIMLGVGAEMALGIDLVMPHRR